MTTDSKSVISFDAASEINTELSLAKERKWYAVFTVPRSEKSAVRHLDMRNIESFLPTYETVQVWKNRQKKRITHPLFPSYLFVHIP